MENLDFCIEALRGAMLLSKQALQVEIAVCFVVYHQFDGDTGTASMKALRSIYASAGRADCLTADDPSYQTVNRRMRRCGDLYAQIGHKRIKRLLKDKYGAEAIEIIKQYIEPLEIASMDDVSAHAGKPRMPPEAKKQKQLPHDRRATDAPGTVHVKTKHIDLPVPPDVSKAELLSLAQKLMRLAERME